MKTKFITISTVLVFLLTPSSPFAQSTSPAFSYEESYRFPEKYAAYEQKKAKSATVFEKELYVGKFGKDGYFAVTRDDGAYDFSRPDPLGPGGETRFRLKLPF